MKLESKKLLFLLSSGMSLARWNELGVLSREVDIYSRLAGHFRELWWYSYGENDHRFAKRLGCIKLFSPDRPVSCNPQAVEDYNRAMIDKHPDFFNQFDFAKTNQVSAAYMGAELKKAFGARLIIRQGYWYPLKYRLHTRNPLSAASLYYLHQPRLYQMADAIILTSQAARRKLTQAYAIDESLVHCLENPVNTAVFRPYHPVNDNAVSVLFIGRLAFQKNIISLVKAVSSLPVSLTIVGDGRYRKKILKLKEKYRLDLRILTHIDNFALPSLYNNPPRYLRSPLAVGRQFQSAAGGDGLWYACDSRRFLGHKRSGQKRGEWNFVRL